MRKHVLAILCFCALGQSIVGMKQQVPEGMQWVPDEEMPIPWEPSTQAAVHMPKMYKLNKKTYLSNAYEYIFPKSAIIQGNNKVLYVQRGIMRVAKNSTLTLKNITIVFDPYSYISVPNGSTLNLENVTWFINTDWYFWSGSLEVFTGVFRLCSDRLHRYCYESCDEPENSESENSEKVTFYYKSKDRYFFGVSARFVKRNVDFVIGNRALGRPKMKSTRNNNNKKKKKNSYRKRKKK